MRDGLKLSRHKYGYGQLKREQCLWTVGVQEASGHVHHSVAAASGNSPHSAKVGVAKLGGHGTALNEGNEAAQKLPANLVHDKSWHPPLLRSPALSAWFMFSIIAAGTNTKRNPCTSVTLGRAPSSNPQKRGRISGARRNSVKVRASVYPDGSPTSDRGLSGTMAEQSTLCPF
ncbi:hypothetical protein AK812_SmicGene15694 [Symbiodinium microadriaticum]|uniref:Uncharacterized protein n=1 Tax=Symbiodinium microadriaticum TaxID=2951 RepID=A0A1Q9E2B9_SYMMI|nr:hypothetical protein AK812_SmicGene15694 [Symbiodinium microadriaticum]